MPSIRRLPRFLRRDRRSALLLAVAVFALLCALSPWAHPLETSYDNDSYHVQAERLLAGEWPRDVFRPMLYVLLTAATGWATGDCFLGGKIVSALGIALMVVATHRLARELHGRAAALAAACLAAASPVALRYGLVVMTDALFAGLFTLALAAILKAARRPDLRSAAAAGVAVAMAYWCRYPALVLLPVAAAAAFCGVEPGRRLRRAAACLLAAAAALLPHMTLTWLQFDRPFHDENWRSMAMRHYSPQLDFSYLMNNPFDGLGSVLAHDPALVLQHALAELASMWEAGLRGLLVGPQSGYALGTVLFVLTLGAALVSWTRRPTAAALLALGAGGYLALVATTFFAWERCLLPVLPPLLAQLAFAAVHGLRRMAAAGRAPWFRSRLAALALGALVCTSLWNAWLGLEALARQAPRRAVEVARELAARTGPAVGIVSNCPFLGRHCPGRHHAIWFDRNPNASLLRPAPPPGEWHWLLANRTEMDNDAWRALDTLSFPGLEQFLDEPDVRVWRVGK